MCKEKVLFCNVSIQGYDVDAMVPADKNCNGWTVKNKGTTICIVNGEPVDPNDFKTFGMNRGEIYIGRIDISFQVPIPAPPVVTNQAYLTQKFYVKKGNKRQENMEIDEYISQ